jgi:hypothetical protein
MSHDFRQFCNEVAVSTNAAGSADLRRPQKRWHQLLADRPDRVIDTRARFRAPLQIGHGILQQGGRSSDGAALDELFNEPHDIAVFASAKQSAVSSLSMAKPPRLSRFRLLPCPLMGATLPLLGLHKMTSFWGLRGRSGGELERSLGGGGSALVDAASARGAVALSPNFRSSRAMYLRKR